MSDAKEKYDINDPRYDYKLVMKSIEGSNSLSRSRSRSLKDGIAKLKEKLQK